MWLLFPESDLFFFQERKYILYVQSSWQLGIPTIELVENSLGLAGILAKVPIFAPETNLQ